MGVFHRAPPCYTHLMSDRFFLPLALLIAVAMVVLSLVFPAPRPL